MTYKQLWHPLTAIYPESEARWIARTVLETRYGLTQADILMGREEAIEESGLQDMSLAEINEEIRKTRYGEDA